MALPQHDTPTTLNLAYVTGDSFSRELTVVGEDGNEVDVSGYTVTAQVLDSGGSPISPDITVDTTDAATGKLVISGTTANSTTWAGSSPANWKLVLASTTAPTTDTKTWWYGTFTLSADGT